MRLTGATGYRYTEVRALIGLAAALAGLGRTEEALGHAQRARAMAGEIGFRIVAADAAAVVAGIRTSYPR